MLIQTPMRFGYLAISVGFWVSEHLSLSVGGRSDSSYGSPDVHPAHVYDRTPDPAAQSPVTRQRWHGWWPITVNLVPQ